jgi:CspA family cold shock protein
LRVASTAPKPAGFPKIFVSGGFVLPMLIFGSQSAGFLRGGSRMADSEKQIDKAEGIIKWFDARKGFGFIIGPQGQDIFVHFSVIDQDQGFRTFRDGEKVVYSAQAGPKGWAATHARALARETASAS